MELKEIVKDAFEKAFPGESFDFVRVVPATDPKFGDYQCNDALKIAKKFGLKPRDAAAKVAAAMDPSLKVEIAGPGFLNLTVSSDWLNSQLATLSEQPLCGIPHFGWELRAASCELSQPVETVRFRNPGPAISTFENGEAASSPLC